MTGSYYSKRCLHLLNNFSLVLVLILGNFFSFWVSVWPPGSPRLTEKKGFSSSLFLAKCQMLKHFALLKPHVHWVIHCYWRYRNIVIDMSCLQKKDLPRTWNLKALTNNSLHKRRQRGRHSGQVNFKSKDKEKDRGYGDIKEASNWWKEDLNPRFLNMNNTYHNATLLSYKYILCHFVHLYKLKQFQTLGWVRHLQTIWRRQKELMVLAFRILGRADFTHLGDKVRYDSKAAKATKER